MNVASFPLTFSLTRHAQTRISQRGIRKEALALVLRYGVSSYQPGDCESLRLGRAECRILVREGIDLQLLQVASKLCAIVSRDGQLVTCYHQRRTRTQRPHLSRRAVPLSKPVH